MVNYRRVVCEVALLAAIVAVVSAAPTPDCVQKLYDQRQNGTENYRLNIDGVVIAVAPAETLLSALGDMDDLIDLALEDYNTDYFPKPPQGSSQKPDMQLSSLTEKPQGQKPQEEKPAEGKPQEMKPAEDKPQEMKPSEPESPLSDVSLGNEIKSQKKEASIRKQEKAQRLKQRLASFLLPLLRKTRHH